MAARKFKSKVDRWILVLILVVIVVQVVAVTAAITEAGEPGMITSLILAMIGIVALMVWLLLGTHYTVDRGIIRIVSGPFRWKVPVEDITSVRATRNPLSSPALSLDRLSIRYGKRRRIMISPADKAGFLKAIGHELDT
ncbi:MAG: PH domain-containing protein [Woeseiaceae bacterium]|nr:PH domain-containing protein [Woeseiaceae bacterium]